MQRPLILTLAAACGLVARTALAVGTPTFTAEFVDGSRVSAPQIEKWHKRGEKTTLAGRYLFDENKPVRWLLNDRIELERRPVPFIEFFGGDVLPAEFVDCRSGRTRFLDEPDHLIVRPLIAERQPKKNEDTVLRVLPEWVQRIVFSRPSSRRYEPGHAFLIDGRQVAFQSARFTPDGLRLLRDTEVIDLSYRELAELHMPQSRPWQRYFRMVATLLPEAEGRLLQIETADGLTVTSAADRLVPHGGGDWTKWSHMVQPVWSLDPLWLDYPVIRLWRFFAPHEVPLSMIEPAYVVQRSLGDARWPAIRNRNVLSEALSSSFKPFGWGIGVHAHCELRFPLPSSAKKLRLSVGLDSSTGRGGCARAHVLVSAGDDPADATVGVKLWSSPLMIGAEQVHDSGELALNLPADRDGWLVLRAEDAANDRPSGADPFDIRDHVNWLQPMVLLDAEELQRELDKQEPERLPAWDGWAIKGDPERPLNFTYRLDRQHEGGGRYVRYASPRVPFLTLTRTVKIDADNDWLLMAMSEPDLKPSDSAVQVQVDGKRIAQLTIPHQPDRREPSPLMVSLSEYRGKRVEIALVHLPPGPNATIDWRALKFTDRGPDSHSLFANDASFLTRFTDGRENVKLSTGERYAGGAALEMAPAVEPATVRGLSIPIHAEPQLGEYRYLRFAWKKKSGKRICLELRVDRNDDDGRQIIRYMAGPDATGNKLDVKLDGKLPEDWVVVTRDLAKDFGSDVRLTSLIFSSLDGEPAFFDEIQLARSENDFYDAADIATDSGGFDRIFSAFAPGFHANGSGKPGMILAREHRGRRFVLRTEPLAPGTPCQFYQDLEVPKSGSTHVLASVSPSDRPNGAWLLKAFAGEDLLLEKTVDAASAPQGWLDVDLDLSAYAGKTVPLRLEQHLIPDRDPTAFWSRIEVLTAPK